MLLCAQKSCDFITSSIEVACEANDVNTLIKVLSDPIIGLQMKIPQWRSKRRIEDHATSIICEFAWRHINEGSIF